MKNYFGVSLRLFVEGSGNDLEFAAIFPADPAEFELKVLVLGFVVNSVDASKTGSDEQIMVLDCSNRLTLLTLLLPP